MSRKPETDVVRVDGYTRVCLTVIAVLLSVVIVGLWADGVRLADGATAQVRAKDGIPDAGAQRLAIIRGIEETNAKLETLIGLFQEGKAKVQVQAEEEKKGDAPKPKAK